MDVLNVFLIISLAVSIYFSVVCAWELNNCGFRNSESRYEPTITGGIKTRYNEFPWHVALYRIHNSSHVEYICGGSLIHPRVVITAAHCVYDENKHKIDSKEVVVATGKYNSSWQHFDKYERRYRVTIKRVPGTYVGLENRYADDIAVLALNGTVPVTKFVRPVCVDWDSSSGTELNTNNTGIIAGWGYTENKTNSERLLAANLSHYNFSYCRIEVREEFTRFVTSDKFCGGNLKKGTVEQGDSGGGLTFPRNGTVGEQYYLYGILSGRDSKDTSIATFTNVSVHMTWINSVLKSIIADSRRGNRGCGTRFKSDSNGTSESKETIPWYVIMYKKSPRTNRMEASCGGSIVHRRIIITSANDVYKYNRNGPDVTYYIVAGKGMNTSWYHVSPGEQRLQVIGIDYPSTFAGFSNRFADDIALLTLNDSLVFNNLVMPACIDWSSDFDIAMTSEYGKTASWLSLEDKKLREKLFYGDIKYVNFTVCRIAIKDSQKSFFTSDKFCGNLKQIEGKQTLRPGGGVFYLRGFEMSNQRVQKYYLYGVLSVRDKNKDPMFGFTDLKYHMPWINSTMKRILQENILKEACGRTYQEQFADPEGAVSTRTRYPWMAAIYQGKDHNFICSGTVIHRVAILTNVECVDLWTGERDDAVNLTVILGKYYKDWTAEGLLEQRIKVEQVHKHEFYDPSRSGLEYNLAILELKEEIKFDYSVQPICTDWQDKHQSYTGTSSIGTVVGWDLDCEEKSQHPQVGFYNYYTSSENDCEGNEKTDCETAFDRVHGEFINGTKFVTIGGGSLTYLSNGNDGPEEAHFIKGIASSSTHDYPTLTFTNVLSHSGWIREVLNSIYEI